MLEKQFIEEFSQEFGLVLSGLVLEIKKELLAQGHKGTGDLERSIELELKTKPNLIQGLIWMNDYGVNIDQGVSASKIPYTPRKRGQGKGGKSKYIQGLYTFWLLKGLNQKEALNAAFATANKHKKEGMPTRGSFIHSTNGRRTKFFTGTIERLEEEVTNLIAEKGESVIALAFNNVLDGFVKRLDPIILRA